MKILLPVDGSQHAFDAVHHAVGLLHSGLHASFVLLNVQAPPRSYEALIPPYSEILGNDPASAGLLALDNTEHLLKQNKASYQTEVLEGDAAKGILDACERHGCDAIIMGARGRGAVQGVLFGSVSQAVLHASEVPVTMVQQSGWQWAREGAE